MKLVLALAAAALLTGCMATTCVEPDPVQPASKAWNKGVNGGEGITPFGSKSAK